MTPDDLAAALARVRELCDEDHGWDARHVDEIRAAIEGP